MKNLLIISFLLLVGGYGFGQFPSNHLDILSKINCELSESWTPEIEQTTSFNGVLDIPAINIDLWNYKSSTEKGNIGVGIYIFNKKDNEIIKNHPWKEQEQDSGFEFVNTDSYSIVISYFIVEGSIYNSLIPTLIEELKQYFKYHEKDL